MRWGVLIGILVVLAAAPQASAKGCSGLSGTFSVVPGSAGAGNIVYRLRVHDGGTAVCAMQGLPVLVLLGLHGKALPTHIVRDPRYVAKPFVLRPGKTASADARFSPDVPGPGEGLGPCERVAHHARVTAAGASFLVPVRPPTSVCEHGRMTFTTYH